MLLEARLAQWIQQGLILYRSQPLMIEAVFYDAAQSGFPSALGPGFFEDFTKRWLLDEYLGGTLRWGLGTYPIVGNTASRLTVLGDPSLETPSGDCYQIVHPATAGLTELLTTQTFSVSTAFTQVPSQFPAFTIRLEKDMQGDAYIGDSLSTFMSGGLEWQVRQQPIIGNYLLSIWTINREATLWLYAWLLTYALQSMGQFASWGLYDVSFTGSDLDPGMQYRAEHAYNRHLLLTSTRIERALTTNNQEVPYITEICAHAVAHYATLASELQLPYPMD